MNESVTLKDIRYVLKHVMAMRYRKVKQGKFLGNNSQSVVGRLLYAKHMFELLG